MLDAIASRELGVATIGSNYLKVVSAAKLVGFGDEYIAWNRHLSKFAHPTAFLVLKVMPNTKHMRGFQILNTLLGVEYCRRCATAFEKVVAAIPAEKLKQS
jgi:hypothetical protein